MGFAIRYWIVAVLALGCLYTLRVVFVNRGLSDEGTLSVVRGSVLMPRACDAWGCARVRLLENGTTVPTPRDDLHDPIEILRLAAKHRRQVDLACTGLPGVGDGDKYEGVVVLGSTVAEGWIARSSTQANFAQTFGSRALNFGISGDRVEDVGWRLKNGLLCDELDPVLFVVVVGEEDVESGEDADVVAAEIRALVAILLNERPDAAVLLVGLLPHTHADTAFRQEGGVFWTAAACDPFFSRISQINHMLHGLPEDLDPAVHYVDCGPTLLTKRHMYPWLPADILDNDDTHSLSIKGYEGLADCLHLPLQLAHAHGMSRRHS